MPILFETYYSEIWSNWYYFLQLLFYLRLELFYAIWILYFIISFSELFFVSPNSSYEIWFFLKFDCADYDLNFESILFKYANPATKAVAEDIITQVDTCLYQLENLLMLFKPSSEKIYYTFLFSVNKLLTSSTKVYLAWDLH